LAALNAKPHVDVITTSGTATGSAPDVVKIRAMNHPDAEHRGISGRWNHQTVRAWCGESVGSC
jgi:hypothetical protein